MLERQNSLGHSGNASFFRKHTSRTFIKQLNCETSGHITSSRNHEFIKRLQEIQRILKKITSYHMFPPFAGCFIYAANQLIVSFLFVILEAAKLN